MRVLASTPIMEQSPKNVTVLDGKDATIVCRAVGAPQPNITWAYNGKFSIVILKYRPENLVQHQMKYN